MPGPEVWARCLLRSVSDSVIQGAETAALALAEFLQGLTPEGPAFRHRDARFVGTVRKSWPMVRRAGTGPSQQSRRAARKMLEFLAKQERAD